jgi:hypothetical protein
MLTVILDSKYGQVRARESAYSVSKRNRHASLEKHVSNYLGSRPEITY